MGISLLILCSVICLNIRASKLAAPVIDIMYIDNDIIRYDKIRILSALTGNNIGTMAIIIELGPCTPTKTQPLSLGQGDACYSQHEQH